MSQRILVIPYFGEFVSKISSKLDKNNYISKQQLKSIWGSKQK